MIININTSMIEEVLKSLNKAIEEYEQIDRNIANTLKNSSFFWNDNTAKRFFEELDSEHQNNNNVINNLKENSDLLTYIINSYGVLGKKIKCNLNCRDTLINKINSILTEINNIIYSYNNLNTYFCPYERSLLYNEKRKLSQTYNLLNNMLSNILDKFNKLEKIEKNIKKRISNLNNFIVNDFDTNKYIK